MKLNSLLERLATRALARWQSTPVVGSLLQSFTDWLGENGYTQKTIRHRLGFLPKLGSWFKRQGLVSLDGLTQEHLDAAQRAYRRRLPQMSQVVGSFRRFLREQDLIREREP